MRLLIDRAYAERLEDRRRRMEAVEKLASLEIEDLPEPEELKRQLMETYDAKLP